MREVVILSETSRRFFLRKSFLISGRDVKSKNLSCSVRDVRKLKGCHHEPAPAAHASFYRDVPAGRARDLLFAGTSQTQRIAGLCHF
jgi:hypothetical protein